MGRDHQPTGPGKGPRPDQGQERGGGAPFSGSADINAGHVAVQNLDGGFSAPRISIWAARAIEKGNFVAARYAASSWRLNKPDLLTLARSLDPNDRFVAKAQALLDDMAPLEGDLPSTIEMAFGEAEGAALWLKRVGRLPENNARENTEAGASALRSPLRPENVTADDDGWNLIAAAAIGPIGILWAESQRKSGDPVARIPAEIIHDLINSSEYTRGFAVGGVAGAWAALEDNAQIAVDLYDLIKDLVTAQIAGGDLAVLRAMRDKVMEMVAAGRQVPAAIKAFADRWNDSSDRGAQGNFHGHVCGYMAVQILALIIGAVTPGGQYADVIRVLKLATDPLGGLLEIGTAAKAARAAKTAGTAEHAAQGAVAAEHAAEGAIAGDRATAGGPGGVWDEGSADAREITFGPGDGRPATSARNTSLDGHVVESHISQMSDRARHVVRQLEAKGWVRVAEIHPDELAEVSRWFGVEIAVVQSPYGRLRVILGHERGVLTRSLRPGEVFLMHTHPVMVSKADQFRVDLDKAGKHVEAVVDWSGQITYFSKSGLKNQVRPDGLVEPLMDYQAAFMNESGGIVGFARIDVLDVPGGTAVKVRE